jgi:hypothetical protein
MDKTAHRVIADQTQKPHNDQHNGNCPQQDFLLPSAAKGPFGRLKQQRHSPSPTSHQARETEKGNETEAVFLYIKAMRYASFYSIIS